jgi:hypothetical protein
MIPAHLSKRETSLDHLFRKAAPKRNRLLWGELGQNRSDLPAY